MSKTITILVTPGGQTKIETHGFSGSACQDATKFLEQTLGQKKSEQLTSEYHTGNNTHTEQTTIRQ